MTIRHLKIFLALCDRGCNATQAALSLHMSQPAVSLAIKELEDYYGARLFDRVGRRLRLTLAGEHMLSYARHITALFGDMERDLRDWEGRGPLRVGASVTIGSRYLPGYIKAFNERLPGVQILAQIRPSHSLEEQISAGELDLALIEGAAHLPSSLSIPYMEDELVCLCSPSLGLSPGRVLSREGFSAQALLLREKGTGTREVFDRALEQAGLSVTPIWESVSPTALINAAAAGLGIAVLSKALAAEPLSKGRLMTIEVEGLSFKRSFNIIHHREKHLTSAALSFIDLCREMGSRRTEYII